MSFIGVSRGKLLKKVQIIKHDTCYWLRAFIMLFTSGNFTNSLQPVTK